MGPNRSRDLTCFAVFAPLPHGTEHFALFAGRFRVRMSFRAGDSPAHAIFR